MFVGINSTVIVLTFLVWTFDDLYVDVVVAPLSLDFRDHPVRREATVVSLGSSTND